MAKTVVITGCSSGFGKQLAVHPARRGELACSGVDLVVVEPGPFATEARTA